MGQANDNATPSPPMRLSTLLLLSSPLRPSLQSLLRALELAGTSDFGFDRLDVVGVESCWEMLDDDSTAHGFVLALRGGERRYLQYVAAYDGEGVDEEVETLPMANERYPSLEGGGIAWDDEVGHLNALLIA